MSEWKESIAQSRNALPSRSLMYMVRSGTSCPTGYVGLTKDAPDYAEESEFWVEVNKGVPDILKVRVVLAQSRVPCGSLPSARARIRSTTTQHHAYTRNIDTK